MKKKYIAPETDVILLNAKPFMAGSIDEDNNADAKKGTFTDFDNDGENDESEDSWGLPKFKTWSD